MDYNIEDRKFLLAGKESDKWFEFPKILLVDLINDFKVFNKGNYEHYASLDLGKYTGELDIVKLHLEILGLLGIALAKNIELNNEIIRADK
jgi:hypothetical protein